MVEGRERRTSRRFSVALPLTIRTNGASDGAERQGETRDVSYRGVYFKAPGSFEAGTHVEMVLTLPRAITMTADVKILCHGHILRVEPFDSRQGVAATIDRYEFLPMSGSST